jgi:D-arabinose 1-dehydrogenase-like Zn-dependent alcohol dehydrogenase
MGATITAISHTASKKQDAEKMGATNFIATSEPDAFKNNAASLELIICTTNDPNMPLKEYVGLLKPHGYLVFVSENLTPRVVKRAERGITPVGWRPRDGPSTLPRPSPL